MLTKNANSEIWGFENLKIERRCIPETEKTIKYQHLTSNIQ
jgi:hypothetical protein